jgi:uncharacterized protein YhaN
MRLERLELIRYGRFTGQMVSLPCAQRDFHVVVGPNEAGKSTVRSAISDLLYGFPKSPPHAFLHPMSELRLGALVEHAGERLEFHRTKANKQTVRTASDEVLPDAVLSPYLGAVDRDFFEQMFGLDHRRLVEGGDGILSAHNDIGQILFQSASGMDNLGRIRDALVEEADKLWSVRRSKDRVFYAAHDQFEEAFSALKSLVVRPKDWTDAEAAVADLMEVLRKAKNDHAELDEVRVKFERIRLVERHIRTLREKEADLRALGEADELPDDAIQTLDEAETAIAQAKASFGGHQRATDDARRELDQTVCDTGLLALSEDIESLNEQRLQFRAHESGIHRRQAEVDAQWRVACAAAAELGWTVSSEDELRALLPPLTARRSLERLVRDHGGAKQALDSALKAKQDKEDDLAALSRGLETLAVSEVPVVLKAALGQAQRLGDSAASRLEKQTNLAELEAIREHALLALGASRRGPAALRTMMLPAHDTIQGFLTAQSEEDAEARTLGKQITRLRNDVQRMELEATQYCAAHDVITRADVAEARRSRDMLWATVKSDQEALRTQASRYEQLIARADDTADRREGTVQEASELQAKTDALARASEQLAGVEREQAALKAAATQRAERFEILVSECGLPGIRPDALAAWAAARNRALEADDAATKATAALQVWDRQVQESARALTQQLSALDQAVGTDSPLETLVLQASEYVQAIESAGGRRRALEEQQSTAQGALARLAAETARAQAEMDKWEADWEIAATQTGSFSTLDVGHAEGALELLRRIDDGLDEMRKLRVDRINPMQADLDRLAKEANRLVQAVAVDLVGRPAAEIALALVERLRQAKAASDKRARLEKECVATEALAQKELSVIARQQAALEPLQARAGVNALPDLRDAIGKSDQRRRIRNDIAEAEERLAEVRDGLSREQLEAEVDSANLADLHASANSRAARMKELLEQQNQTSADLAMAKARLAKFAGSDDAAKWEGKRQDALAKMSDAIERYIKVATAAHLLRWSIERYRETKQGPMLKQAAAIFSKLTLGSFESLTVDFEHDPPRLQGKRHGGQLVGVEGMSDGARDQLYLALRLAALDMHLASAHTLPFIADDLVINYDDQRSRAAIEALGDLSTKTQVVFLTHHEHLLPLVREVLGSGVNVVEL